jgi:hypothetical protein
MTTTRDYLDEIEAQLVQRTPAVAAAQPGRARWERVAALPALAAAAAIVAAIILLSTSGGGSPARRPTQPAKQPAGSHHSSRRAAHPRTARHAHVNPTAPAGSSTAAQPAGPVPAGFSPGSFSAISELRWWLLGTAPCSSPPCTSIVRTDDGGRTFAGIPAPRTTQVSQLRFADARNGFAFGPALWVTHDAGAHWHQIGLAGQVAALEPGGGYVYAIYLLNGRGVLMRSPVSTDHWVTLQAAGDALGGLWVYGRDVLLEAGTAGRQLLMISHDGGATFASHAVPPSVACRFEEKPPAIWAECATGMMSGVWRSTDGGAGFAGVGGDAARSGGPLAPNSAVFGAASATTAVYGFQTLYRTTDGGARWAPVTAPRGVRWIYLGFTDATHGAAIAQFASASRLYYTTDGGASYHPVTVR